MFATSSTTAYPAMAAGQRCSSRVQRMQSRTARFSAQTMCGMWATAGATASILLIQTGVLASVSLFVLLLILGSFLLVSLAGRVGFLRLTGLLSLSCLTRLAVSLVGLMKGLSPGTNAGD